jgi:hypothetical protein
MLIDKTGNDKHLCSINNATHNMTASQIFASAHKSTRADREYCKRNNMAFNYAASFRSNLRSLYRKQKAKPAFGPALSSYAPQTIQQAYFQRCAE